MRDLSLCIGCDVVAMIKNKEFLIIKNHDDVGMIKVTLEEFQENLKRYQDVCSKTWSKRLKDEYAELCEEVGVIL